MMTENTSTAEQEASRSARSSATWEKRLYLSGAFLCISTSVVILVLDYFLFNEDCFGCRSYVAGILGFLAAVFFIAGLLLFSVTLCRGKRQNTSAPEVVISLIPAEDLEKSPAPILPGTSHHVPRHKPSASSTDLPDYFTVIQNINELFISSVDAEIWTDDFPETPPPSYEQALEMTTD